MFIWTIHQTKISEKIYQFQISASEARISFIEVLELWQKDSSFRAWYTNILIDSPFEAYFWEHPPITVEDINKSFEFVLINSIRLPSLKPNPKPFQSFFDGKLLVVNFPNLRGDAHLVVPSPISGQEDFTHLASFLRSAEEDQIHQFWQAVGRSFKSKINEEPIWLSTHGLGVAWLHVRIDQYPKYYHHTAYRVL